LADHTARREVAEATLDSAWQDTRGRVWKVEGGWKPVAAPRDDARRTAGRGAMADRMLPAHLPGHVPSQEECVDPFEEGEEGQSKDRANVAYRLFHSFRQW
jgi:hypothetical protein